MRLLLLAACAAGGAPRAEPAAAAAAHVRYLVLGAGFAGIAAGYFLPLVIGPQVLVTLAIYPLVTQVVALFDRIRLLPLRTV
jgi:rod shape-determining protein MreD